MQNGEGYGVEQKQSEESFESKGSSALNQSSKDDSSFLGAGQKGGDSVVVSQARHVTEAVPPSSVTIIVSQLEEIANPKVSVSKNAASDGDEKTSSLPSSAKKGFLPRSESYQEQCRVCQQQTEEPLMDLGCRCRGELAKAHRSCIEIWFRTKGSNKCEICQQVAANVPFPESQQSTNYWVWRIDSAYGRGRGDNERRCFSPLWVAFAILIGGLLLDVLISVSLGVSALPVNIIIGVLIILGLGTAMRLALECCQEWGARRTLQRAEMAVNPGYHPAV